MAHVWTGADPVELDDVDDYELGSRNRINAAVTITGIRIWSPGERARSGRNGKLWVTAVDWTGQSLVTQVALPDTLPAGWSEHTFDAPVPVAAVPAYYVASFDTATAPPASSDYGAVSGGLAADHDSADGAVTIVAAGGRFNETPGSYPTSVFGTPFYGVDLVYSLGAGSEVQGSVSATFTFSAAAVAVREVQGAVAAAFAFNAAAVATRVVQAAAAATFTFAATTAAVRTVRAAATATFTFSASAAAVVGVTPDPGIAVAAGTGATITVTAGTGSGIEVSAG